VKRKTDSLCRLLYSKATARHDCKLQSYIPAPVTHDPISTAIMVDLTAQVLDALSQTEEPILSTDAFPSIPSTEIKSALDRLKSREMVIYDTIDKEEAILTAEAEGVAANGSPEAKVFEAVQTAIEGLKISDLPVCWPYCTPAHLEVRESADADQHDRKLWERRMQASVKERLSKLAGSRRTRTY
jgi:hypothetical protein